MKFRNQKLSTMYLGPVALEPDQYHAWINFIKSEGSEIPEADFEALSALPNYEDLKEQFGMGRYHTVFERLQDTTLGKAFVANLRYHEETATQFQNSTEQRTSRNRAIMNLSDYAAYSYLVSNAFTATDVNVLSSNPNLLDKTLALLYSKYFTGLNTSARKRIQTHPNAGELTAGAVQAAKRNTGTTTVQPGSITLQDRLQMLQEPGGVSPEVLMDLSNDLGNVRREVARACKVPEVLAYLANDSDVLVRENTAYNMHTPVETLVQLADDTAGTVRQGIAHNKNTPLEILVRLAEDKDAGVRAVVARSRNTPGEVLTQLATDKAIGVRQGVARNKNAPPEALALLANDRSTNIRLDVSQMVNLPLELLLHLANDKHPEVRANVARSEVTPLEVLLALANDSSSIVRYGVARNKNASPEILSRLANDNSASIRESVALNERVTEEILAQLVNDSNVNVRNKASAAYSLFHAELLPKEKMKAENYRGKESFDHNAVSYPLKQYMYDMGVAGQDWTRLIYMDDVNNEFPVELTEAFNLHHRPVNISNPATSKFLGWVGGKYDESGKILYVTEMQSDLLQRTFELSPKYLSDPTNKIPADHKFWKWTGLKSKLENRFNGWQKVFFNQALREAKKKGAHYVYVPTSAYYKTRHSFAPTQYYDMIVSDRPHTTTPDGKWNVITVDENMKIATMLSFGNIYKEALDRNYWNTYVYTYITAFVKEQMKATPDLGTKKTLAKDGFDFMLNYIPDNVKSDPEFNSILESVRDKLLSEGYGDIFAASATPQEQSPLSFTPTPSKQDDEGDELVDPFGEPERGGSGESYLQFSETPDDIEDYKKEMIDQYLDALGDAMHAGDQQKINSIKQRIQELQSLSSLKLSWMEKNPDDFVKETDDGHGNLVRYDENYKLHSLFSPAVVGKDGSTYWHNHGEFHREDGPAIEKPGGEKSWYLNGKLIGSTSSDFTEKDFEDYKKSLGITSSLHDLQEIRDIQCSPGNYDFDEYNRGLANGLILADSVANDREEEPKFISSPEKLSWMEKNPDDFVKEATDEDGTIRRYNSKGELHSLFSPAIEFTDGTKFWVQDGKRHRIDGPAVDWGNGDKWWFINDQLIGTTAKGFTDEDFKSYKRAYGITSSLKLSWAEDACPAEVNSYLGHFTAEGNNVSIEVYPEGVSEFIKLCEEVSMQTGLSTQDDIVINRAFDIYISKLFAKAKLIFSKYGGLCSIEYGTLRVIDVDMDKFYSDYPTSNDIKQFIEQLVSNISKLSWMTKNPEDFVTEELDEDGDLCRYDAEGKLHSLYSPAVAYKDGGEDWYKHGLLHRENGPAIDYVTGKQVWYLDGALIGVAEDGFTQEDFENYKREHGITSSRKLSWMFGKYELPVTIYIHVDENTAKLAIESLEDSVISALEAGGYEVRAISHAWGYRSSLSFDVIYPDSENPVAELQKIKDIISQNVPMLAEVVTLFPTHVDEHY